MKTLYLFISLFLFSTCFANANDQKALAKSLQGNTPIIDDLQELTDTIGARMTGTEGNNLAVAWALNKFKEMGINTKLEAVEMPRGWQEREAKGYVTGDLTYELPIVSMPFTNSTIKQGLSGQLKYINNGSDKAFNQVKNLENTWLLVETDILDDEQGIHGLFKEYIDFAGIEQRAIQHSVAGIIYMSSRDKNLLYRHLPSKGAANNLPIIVAEREEGLKLKRLLNKGYSLHFAAKIETGDGQPYQVNNVIAEIKGKEKPDEIVLLGAHIDSFDLGTGALDNGSNVSLVLDIARQIKRLGITPKRTMRFALYNGEEQGLYGSWAYTKHHKMALNKHVMTATIDIGTGKINGFFTNGRVDFVPALESALNAVQENGPFSMINVPVVGTDNYDFMVNGVPNIVASQEDANYASNYHAESDTFDKVDTKQLKQNASTMGALMLGIANLNDITWQKHNMAQVEALIEAENVEASMKTFGLYQGWKNKTRPIR
ncbi:M28 family peptidase [Thalassotalea sediminis]|uniref:M28 family peptidase n=1 Tax=Thalassotalea sediminis TaxID=1759089 RepID=UPI002572652F|nr:M28 family peptidase [Thalassotalea sediminis]